MGQELRYTRELGAQADAETVVAVTGGFHGTEPGGVKAIDRFLGGETDYRDFSRDRLDAVMRGEPRYPVEDATVRFVVANPGAMEAGTGYVDTDLHSVIGVAEDANSDVYEERVAAELREEIGDTDYVLDLHAYPIRTGTPVMNPGMAAGGSRSRGEQADPCVVLTTGGDEEVELARRTGLDNVYDYSAQCEECTGLPGYDEVTGVIVEAGPMRSQQAADTAYQSILNVLGSDVIDAIPYEPADIPDASDLSIMTKEKRKNSW